MQFTISNSFIFIILLIFNFATFADILQFELSGEVLNVTGYDNVPDITERETLNGVTTPGEQVSAKIVIDTDGVNYVSGLEGFIRNYVYSPPRPGGYPIVVSSEFIIDGITYEISDFGSTLPIDQTASFVSVSDTPPALNDLYVVHTYSQIQNVASFLNEFTLAANQSFNSNLVIGTDIIQALTPPYGSSTNSSTINSYGVFNFSNILDGRQISNLQYSIDSFAMTNMSNSPTSQVPIPLISLLILGVSIIAIASKKLIDNSNAI